MVYVSEGRIVQSRSWSFGLIPELFWGLINGISLFFQTLVQPNLNRSGRSYTPNDNGRNSWRSPPGNARRRIGGFGSSLDCSSAPMPGGG